MVPNFDFHTWVSVPVLSEKMYSICPNSSLSVVVLALAGVSVSSWYMARSQLMMKLSASRITSTLKERRNKMDD